MMAAGYALAAACWLLYQTCEALEYDMPDALRAMIGGCYAIGLALIGASVMVWVWRVMP